MRVAGSGGTAEVGDLPTRALRTAPGSAVAAVSAGLERYMVRQSAPPFNWTTWRRESELVGQISSCVVK